jgi:hypothetical protein
MPKFDIGDNVQMPGVPIAVKVLEFGTCNDDDCEFGGETFRFDDPGTGEADWSHVAEFEKCA